MRTENLQLRLQLRSTIQSTLNDIMYQNNISVIDMEEAIEHYLLSLKEAALLEYANWTIQDKDKAIKDILDAQAQEETKEILEEE